MDRLHVIRYNILRNSAAWIRIRNNQTLNLILESLLKKEETTMAPSWAIIGWRIVKVVQNSRFQEVIQERILQRSPQSQSHHLPSPDKFSIAASMVNKRRENSRHHCRNRKRSRRHASRSRIILLQNYLKVRWARNCRSEPIKICKFKNEWW